MSANLKEKPVLQVAKLLKQPHGGDGWTGLNCPVVSAERLKVEIQ